MVEKIVGLLMNCLIEKQCIEYDKKDIYAYGLKLILSDIINFSIILFISVLLKHIVTGIVFLITFCSIRKHSGGFHAKTFWLCRLTMITTFLCVVAAFEIISQTSIQDYLVIALNLFSVLIIVCLAPVKHPNKKLTDEQSKSNRKKAIIASSAFAVVSIALIFTNNIPIYFKLLLTTPNETRRFFECKRNCRGRNDSAYNAKQSGY